MSHLSPFLSPADQSSSHRGDARSSAEVLVVLIVQAGEAAAADDDAAASMREQEIAGAATTKFRGADLVVHDPRATRYEQTTRSKRGRAR